MSNKETSPPHILVISGSLNPESRSRVLAQTVSALLAERPVTHQFIDLRDYPLPLCDGEDAYDAPQVPQLEKLIQPAQAMVVGVPIYNFDVNAAVKNLVELTGSSWEGKIVGFLCAAGGRSSYMSVMGFANSLMLDFRCLIIPRFVYATGSDFREEPPGNEVISSTEIVKRLAGFTDEVVRLASALG